MRRLAFVLCCLVANGIAFANGPVAVESLFEGGELPEGWRGGESDILSPTYSNYVSHISLAYGEERTGAFGTLALFAIDYASQSESKIADLNTFTSAAQFDFPVGTDFRAFRIVTNGVALASFTVVWMDTRLAAPTNIAIANNTGSSFDISWSPVENAAGYCISVWTNMTVGASAGTTNWIETFTQMKTSTGTAAFGNNKNTNDSKADHPDEWTEFDEVYLSKNAGHIRLGKQATIGRLTVPSYETGVNSFLRVVASRYDGNNRGQNLAIDFISPDGTQTNRNIHVLTVTDNAYYQSLADLPQGWKIVLTVAAPDNGSDFRVDLGSIAYIDGYDPGDEECDVFRTVNLDGGRTSIAINDLPPVAVNVSVQALAANAAESSEGSDAVTVDLAHPPPVPQLAVSGASVAEHGYSENFDALNGLGTTADWTDGLTLPCWQARKGEVLVDKISTSHGMGGKSGKTSGLYAYHGTNQNDTASYSLAVVANSSKKMKFCLAVTNDMEGFALSNFAVSFTARQWTFTSDRKVAQSLHFEYLVTNEVGAVSAPSNCWHEVEALRFDATGPGEGTNSLAAAASVGKADWATGSAFANLEAVLEGVLLHSGEVLMLRWRPDPVSNGEVLGVDDVSITCSATSLGTTMRFVKSGYGF